MSFPEYPEIEWALDGEDNGYLIKIEGELLFDINELQSSTLNDFHDTFEAGIKIGLKIAAMRAKKTPDTLWGKIDDLRRDLNQTKQHLARANKTIKSREESIDGLKEEMSDRTNRMRKAQQLMGCSGCGGLHCPGGPSCNGQGDYQR